MLFLPASIEQSLMFHDRFCIPFGLEGGMDQRWSKSHLYLFFFFFFFYYSVHIVSFLVPNHEDEISTNKIETRKRQTELRFFLLIIPTESLTLKLHPLTLISSVNIVFMFPFSSAWKGEEWIKKRPKSWKDWQVEVTLKQYFLQKKKPVVTFNRHHRLSLPGGHFSSCLYP